MRCKYEATGRSGLSEGLLQRGILYTPTAPGDVPEDMVSDRSSILLASTRKRKCPVHLTHALSRSQGISFFHMLVRDLGFLKLLGLTGYWIRKLTARMFKILTGALHNLTHALHAIGSISK